jgi:ADP-ribose pyrophosphatase YjhB (NUDIX family)
MKKGWLLEKDFNFIYSRVPRICVDVIIKTNQGILFTKRTIEPGKGKWHFIGGGIHFKETIRQAAMRIAKEELNLEIIPLRYLGILEYPNELNGKRHSISIPILAEIKSGKIKLNEDAEEFMFSKKIPQNIIKEQGIFLEKRHLL